MTKLILSNSNKFALIDSEDYERVKNYNWCLSDYGVGYVYANIPGTTKTILLHRLILNAPDGVDVDHKPPGDKLDNRKANLRLCTRSQNCANKEKMVGRVCSSKYKGVYLNKQRGLYQAQITVNYKCRQLGRFKTQVEAALAYNFAAKHYFGEFATLNDVHI